MKRITISLMLVVCMLIAACSGGETVKESSNPLAESKAESVAESSEASLEDSTEASTESNTESDTESNTESSVDNSEDAESSEDASSDAPEASEPEVSEPEASEPESSKPEESKPETSEPEESKPEKPGNNSLWNGSGTKSDPYMVMNVNDLMNLSKVLNKSGLYFKQGADIDCASVGTWPVIGEYSNPFKNNYDGNGYKISNLLLNKRVMDEYGGYDEDSALFGAVEDATLQNMNFVNANNGSGTVSDVASLTIYALGTTTIKNCHANVNFKRTDNGYTVESGAGGLVCAIYFKDKQFTVMENCTTSGTIQSANAGGLVGSFCSEQDYYEVGTEPKASIKNCSSSVTIEDYGYGVVGGLIGRVKNANVYNCHATGDVYSYGQYIGGLIGEVNGAGEIAYCYATGDVYGNKFSKLFNNSYGDGAFCGGLIGYTTSRSVLHDCYATGDVFTDSVYSNCRDSTSKNGGLMLRYRNPCGSLVGCLSLGSRASYGKRIDVYNCYATGVVTGDNICKGEMTDNYFTYCNTALIGLVYDFDTYHYIIDDSKKDQSDWAGFSDSNIGNFTNNYNLQDLRDYFTVMPEFIKGNWVIDSKYTAMPTHKFVEIISKSELKDESTFVGFDFNKVWKMGANGPELR